jgi:hypothetical protein
MAAIATPLRTTHQSDVVTLRSGRRCRTIRRRSQTMRVRALIMANKIAVDAEDAASARQRTRNPLIKAMTMLQCNISADAENDC